MVLPNYGTIGQKKGIIYVFTLNEQLTTLQVGDMLLVIAYATFGHSRPSGHLVCRDVAYKDSTRRRFFSGNSMRGGSKMHVFRDLSGHDAEF